MKKLHVGIAGLGRLGKVHASNLAYRLPGAELSAACAISSDDLAYAQRELGVQALYTDFNEMIQSPKLDAVAIVTSSPAHCEQIAAALDAGKHVFCEKPLGVTMKECSLAEAAVNRHPELTFFLGFMRRFDPSYAYAKAKVDSGAIGKPYLVKATGIDPESAVEESIRFAKTSGGIILDMAIHDIDLMRWFLGAEPSEVYALGTTVKHPEFQAVGDDETAIATYRFIGGAMGTLHVGRTAAHGYHVETEIVGTEGSLRVSPVPCKNLTVLYDSRGVVTECVENFQIRFDEAYRLEMAEFVDCALSGRKPNVSIYDGIAAAKIAYATTEAWKSGRPVQL